MDEDGICRLFQHCYSNDEATDTLRRLLDDYNDTLRASKAALKAMDETSWLSWFEAREGY